MLAVKCHKSKFKKAHPSGISPPAPSLVLFATREEFWIGFTRTEISENGQINDLASRQVREVAVPIWFGKAAFCIVQKSISRLDGTVADTGNGRDIF